MSVCKGPIAISTPDIIQHGKSALHVDILVKEGGQNMESLIINMSGSIKQYEHCSAYEKRIGMNGKFFSSQDLNQFKDAFSPADFVVFEKFNVAIEKISLFSLLSPMKTK